MRLRIHFHIFYWKGNGLPEFSPFLAHIFLQGHAAPALYSMWVEAGFLKESELFSLCHVDSSMEGHPTPVGVTHVPTKGAQAAKSKRLMCVCIDVYVCIRRSSTLWTWPLALWDRVSAWPVGWLTLGNTLTRPGNPQDVYTHMQVITASWVCVSFHTPLLFQCSNFVGVRWSYMLLRFFCSNNHWSQQSHLS